MEAREVKRPGRPDNTIRPLSIAEAAREEERRRKTSDGRDKAIGLARGRQIASYRSAEKNDTK